MRGTKSESIGGVLSGMIRTLAENIGYRRAERAGRRADWGEWARLGDARPERVYHRLSILGRPPKQEQAPKQDQAPAKRTREDGDFYQCANCSRIYTEEQLALVDDWWERCEPGETVPDGQCPDESCGALCYWMGEEPTAEYFAYCNEENAPDPRD